MTARVVPLRVSAVDDVEITLDGDLPAVIKPGTYEASIVGSELGRIKKFGNAMAGGVPKLRLDFDVMLENGDRVRLSAWYNVDEVLDRTTGRKRLRVGKHSRYARDWCTVMGRRPSRHDRMAPSALVNAFAKVTVRTVTKGYRTTVSAKGHRELEQLSEVNRYSVVDRIDELIAGGHAAR